MCTYEHLVDATLPHGLIPYVVPQLKTITLGGAVTGLGIESTSFRNGLPHESVEEMDVFTGAGEVVTTRPGDDLFDTFPNSYGSLGYATRLRIKLERVPDRVELRHVRFDDAGLLAKTVAEIVETRQYDGLQVDGLDGVAFQPGEYYLTLARWLTPTPRTGRRSSRATTPASRSTTARSSSARDRPADDVRLPVALGHRLVLVLGRVRRPEPARSAGSGRGGWRRSDVYHQLIGLNHRTGFMDWVDRRKGRPQREQVVQDVEVPVERLEEFLAWFDAEVGMRPVWLCPLVSPGTSTAPSGRPTRCAPARRTSTSASGAPCTSAPRPPTRPLNRAIEAKVQELGGHKSLYSEAFYDRETFDRLYDGPHLAAVKERYDPDDRLLSLYDKAVTRPMTILMLTKQLSIAEALDSMLKEPLPLRFTAYDGSATGPEDSPYGIHLATERGLNYILTAPGDLGFGRAYVAGDLEVLGAHPGDPYEAFRLIAEPAVVPPARRPAEALTLVRTLGISHLRPPAPPPQEAPSRLRRTFEGLRHSLGRDAEAIHHHYDVSNTFYEYVLGPSMTYTCAVFPTEDATLEEAQAEKYDLVARKLDLQAGPAAARPRLRLGRHGAPRGPRVRRARARRHPLPRAGVAGRSRRSRRRGSTTSPRSASWTTGTSRRRDFDAISSIGLTEHVGVKNYPAYFGFIRDRLRPQGRLLNHCITRPRQPAAGDRRSSSTATSSPTAS